MWSLRRIHALALTLLFNSSRLNFEDLADDFVDLDWLLPKHKKPVTLEDFRARLDRHAGIPILKTHSCAVRQEFTHDEAVSRLAQSILDTSRIIYVFRDGRDVLTSLSIPLSQRHCSATAGHILCAISALSQRDI